MNCWVKLTDVRDDVTYVNLEHAQEIIQTSNTAYGTFTRIVMIGACDNYIRVKETPEQIFQAMSQDAIYPWASSPGAVFMPGGLPAGNGGG